MPFMCSMSMFPWSGDSHLTNLMSPSHVFVGIFRAIYEPFWMWHRMTFADKTTLAQSSVLGIMSVCHSIILHTLLIVYQARGTPGPKPIQLAWNNFLPELYCIWSRFNPPSLLNHHSSPMRIVSPESRSSKTTGWQMDEVWNVIVRWF